MTDADTSTHTQRVTPDSAMQQHYFFTVFTERFMERIDDVKPVLEEKFPALLKDFVNNLHRLSQHAADMLEGQQITFSDLAESEQTVFLNQFVQHIDGFAMKVHESISGITPEQEDKLRAAYDGRRSQDN